MSGLLSQVDLDRFYAKCSWYGEDHLRDCWEWRGGSDALGYGRFFYGGRLRLAHRVSYEHHVGPISDGLTLDHLCRNPRCVNPWHLEAVTQAENVRRGESPWGRNARKTHCHRGHQFNAENTYEHNGERHCRTCRRERARDRRAAA